MAQAVGVVSQVGDRQKVCPALNKAPNATPTVAKTDKR